jgi:A118 family predicted phage portal protein
MSNMFGFIGNTDSKEITDLIQTEISKEHYKLLEIWKDIYAGYYDEWHSFKVQTVNGMKKKRRHSLSMAKVSANELAKLIFTEKVEINISDKAHHENINDLLQDNRFDKVFQEKVEQMLALGGIILKANPKEQPDGTYKLLIGYITPDCFVPISWENGEVTEGAFLNISRKDKKIYCLFEIHRWQVTTNENEELVKLYTIENVLFEKENELSQPKRVPLSTLYPDLQETASIEGLTQPLFQYIKPNIANNFDLQSPMGVSLYSNSLDTLYAIDVAFDSFIREFKLGKRRIIVPASSVKAVVDPMTGEMHRYFDADDEVYQAFNVGDPDKQKIQDNTVGLRVTEHVAAINALLNLYSMQIGMSPGTFTFDGAQVKTATEVISENSKTYQTIKSNTNIVEEGLRKFIMTLTEVAALYGILNMPAQEFDIEFAWDDSVIGDKYTDSDFYIKLLGSGIVSKKYVMMKVLGLTEEQADEMLQEIKDETASETPDLNSLLNADNPLDGLNSDKETDPGTDE